MAGMDSNTQYDEFIVDSSKLQLVHEIQNKVERMFSIKMYADNSTDDKCKQSWLKVEGHYSDRKNAREYILAVCHPESKQKLHIKDSNSGLLHDETLERIEIETGAHITVHDKMVEIGGSELAVILAMTSLESGGMVVDDTEPDGEMDEKSDMPERSSAKNKWSSKMDSQLERFLDNTPKRAESISDFNKSSASIKMTILKCMTDYEEVSDSDLFPSSTSSEPTGFLSVILHRKPVGSDDASSREGAPSYKLPIYIEEESDEDKVDSAFVDAGKSVKFLTDRFTTAQISPSSSPKASAESKVTGFPEEEYFRSFGKSVGYTEREVEEGLRSCNDKTTPADFLDILNSVQQKWKESEMKDLAKEATMDVTRNNFPPPPKVPSPSSTPVNGRRSLPNEYKKKLVQDFTEETDDSSVEELKRRNVERQKVLKSAFEQGSSCSTDSKSPLKKKRKKKKRKKNSDQVKFVGEGSKENPAIVGSSDDEEETQVLTVWNEKPDQDSDSDDCMIVDETFQVADRLTENNSNDSQPKHGHTDRSHRFHPPPSDSAASHSAAEPWKVVQKPHQRNFKFDQPSNPGGPSNPGDFQYLGGAPNNVPFRFDVPPPPLGQNYGTTGPNGVYTANPIPPPSVTMPILGAGAPPLNLQKNLRYVVIDGSNVAMCHGCSKIYSCRGIKIVIDYFLQRGHTKVTAFVPEWRKYYPRAENPIQEQHLLTQMQEEGHLAFTPSRRVNKRLIAAYDDRFILALAEREGGIVVSNDQYRDLLEEKYSWKKIIEERLLQFTFVGDFFMPPEDPLGRNGPKLDQFLCMPESRKRHTVPYYQEKNPQINAWNAGKTRQPGPIFQRPPPQAWVRPQHGPPQRPYDNNQAQHGGRGRGGPRFNNPQRPQKSEPVRSKAKTKEIEEQLKAIFPENGDKISEILQNHRCETDLEKLTNYLMNAVFPS